MGLEVPTACQESHSPENPTLPGSTARGLPGVTPPISGCKVKFRRSLSPAGQPAVQRRVGLSPQMNAATPPPHPYRFLQLGQEKAATLGVQGPGDGFCAKAGGVLLLERWGGGGGGLTGSGLLSSCLSVWGPETKALEVPALPAVTQCQAEAVPSCSPSHGLCWKWGTRKGPLASSRLGFLVVKRVDCSPASDPRQGSLQLAGACGP